MDCREREPDQIVEMKTKHLHSFIVARKPFILCATVFFFIYLLLAPRSALVFRRRGSIPLLNAEASEVVGVSSFFLVSDFSFLRFGCFSRSFSCTHFDRQTVQHSPKTKLPAFRAGKVDDHSWCADDILPEIISRRVSLLHFVHSCHPSIMASK